MSSQWKLIVRSLLLVVVATLTTWAATGYQFDKAAAVGALTALAQGVVELLGPTSDTGVKWTPPPAG